MQQDISSTDVIELSSSILDQECSISAVNNTSSTATAQSNCPQPDTELELLGTGTSSTVVLESSLQRVTDQDCSVSAVIITSSTATAESNCTQPDIAQNCLSTEYSVDTHDHHMPITPNDLATFVKEIDRHGFLHIESSPLLTFVKITENLNPRIIMSVVIDVNCKFHVNVFGRPVSDVTINNAMNQMSRNLISKASIEMLLSMLSNKSVCLGIDYSLFADVVTSADLKQFTIEYEGKLRSKDCLLLPNKGTRCQSCLALHRRLQMRLLRQKKIKVTDRTKWKKPNKFLRSPVRAMKLRLLARKTKRMKFQIDVMKSRLQLKCKRVIEVEGEKLSETDSNDLLKLCKQYQNTALQQFENGSFQHILWQQQIQYNRLKNKASMRWHPAVIRWCLYLKSKSAKAYDGMRAYLNLPSSRTLYDYTHYMEHGIGLHPKALEQLIVEARRIGCFDAEHKTFVGLLVDEIKIKADLIYHKHSGELIGFVKLDEFSNQLSRLNHSTSFNNELAQCMLVVMVRGITTNLRYPLAAYATKTLTGGSLYTVLWECIEYLEIVAGLKVLFICCDGAVQNRKFFTLNSQPNEPNYKTKILTLLTTETFTSYQIHHIS